MMLTQKKAGAYLEDHVKFASPIGLILLLYDKAIQTLKLSSTSLRAPQQDLTEKGRTLCLAVDIIAELQAVLDRERGGKIAEKLHALYDYMLERLTLANYENNPAVIDEIIALLEELREGWRAATSTTGQKTPPAR